MAMASAGTRGELVAGGAGGFALAFKRPMRCGSARRPSVEVGLRARRRGRGAPLT